VLLSIPPKTISADKNSFSSKRVASSETNDSPELVKLLFSSRIPKLRNPRFQRRSKKAPDYFRDHLQVLTRDVNHLFQIPLGTLTSSNQRRDLGKIIIITTTTIQTNKETELLEFRFPEK